MRRKVIILRISKMGSGFNRYTQKGREKAERIEARET